MANSIEVIKPFADWAMQTSANIQLMGGIGSAALAHDGTRIDMDNKEVVVPDDFELSTQRDNGTLRDLDVLVQSSSPDAIDGVEEVVSLTIGNALEHSVFGFRSAEALARRQNHPLGFVAFKTFLSDRYEQSDGMVKSLVPFSVPIDPESLETWTLAIGDMRVPIPNPAMSLINYTNRSITGVRPKDKDKLDKIITTTFSKEPLLREWAVDGPGREQAILGSVLRSLTADKNHGDPLGLDLSIMTPAELIQHASFMFPDLDARVQRVILGTAMFKAGALASLEANPTIVALWQAHAEPHADTITKNK